jgi:Na+-driven multidrug efflux pump
MQKDRKYNKQLIYTLIKLIEYINWSVGVAVGAAGWQWLVAYINLGCYYLIGIPVGYLIAFPLNLGVQV